MPTSDAEISEIKKLFDLNVFSQLRAIQVFLPLLLKAPNGALIANNTSGASMVNIPLQAAYNASKAAMAMYSDTLRLELAPFNIKVIDLKTGGVKSNFWTGSNSGVGQGAKLPADSLYALARDKIESFIRGDMGITDQDAGVWAKNVVHDLSKNNPPDLIWRGTMATRTWLLTSLPRGTMDNALKKMSGMDVFEKKYKAAEAKKAK